MLVFQTSWPVSTTHCLKTVFSAKTSPVALDSTNATDPKEPVNYICNYSVSGHFIFRDGTYLGPADQSRQDQPS